MSNTRQLAFEILYKIQSKNSYSNLLLDSYLKKNDLSASEKKQVSRLVYGVSEREKLLDYNLSLYLKQPLRKLKPQVLTIMRIGCYEILFSDNVPDSAAVNESVKLSKINKCSFATGLVNAVLRNVSRNGLSFPDENSEDYLSIRYSCEKWICDEWCEHYGRDEAEKILSECFEAPPVYIKVNSLKTYSDELLEKLNAEGIVCSKVEGFDGTLMISSSGSPADTECFKQGLFHVQDLSSQIACRLVGACENDNVLDVCAAPGGKSFTLCENMNGSGQVVSCDIYPHRLKLIENGASRLEINNIKVILNDAEIYNEQIGLFDKVLCDAPCSGLGIIRRKPEIRYKLAEDIDKLTDLQYHILCVSSKYVKPGGKLVYSTCSLNRKENEYNCCRFLQENDDFSVCELSDFAEYGLIDKNMINILPSRKNTDGFFVAVFERVKPCE